MFINNILIYNNNRTSYSYKIGFIMRWLLYWYFNKDEINLDTEKQYYFRAINFTEMIGVL